jgi:hypothetical protein
MAEKDTLEIAQSHASGFWSYTHSDNEQDGGAILKLASLISGEYELLSGSPLNLFVDQDSLSWGDEWQKRLTEFLTKTTFFIPIITPRFFTSEACRRELMEFAGKAVSLGVEELILPILYVRPANYSPDNPDECVALAARMQYVDWTSNRLLDPSSEGYRSAVNKLALRLMEIADRVEQRQLDKELEEPGKEEYLPGIQDLMDDISRLMPEWLDAVMAGRVADAQIDVTWHQVYTPPVDKLLRSHAPPSAVLAAQMRAGREMLLVIERYRDAARTYLARSVELDPLVSALARLIAADPSGFPLVLPLRAAIDEAVANMRGDFRTLRKGNHSIWDHFRELRNRARIFQKCEATWLDEGRLASEGNKIVQRWDAELRLPDPPAQHADDAPERNHVGNSLPSS